MSEETPGGETIVPTADWREALPENIRGWDETKNSDSPEAFWKQVENQRSMVGRSVQIPTGDATDEDREKFFGRMKQHFPEITKAPDYSDPEATAQMRRDMGMPEKSESYIPPEFEIPEGVPFDESAYEVFKTAAHDAGLTQDQYKSIVGTAMEANILKATEATTQFNDSMGVLKKEWGAGFDEKSAEAEKVRSEFFDFIPADGMNAESLRAMSKIAAQFGAENPSLTATADQVRRGSLTPAEAKQRAAEIMGNRAGPYWNVSDPMHRQVKENYARLMEISRANS